MSGITQTVADFAVQTSFKDLPASVVKKTKLILLDSIGCALCGPIIDRTRIALELAEEHGGNHQATIIGRNKTSCSLAAYVNGESINALDFDAVGPLTAHVVPYVLPPCLATAEKAHSSGQALITALAIGFESGGRIASSLNGGMVLKETPPYYEWAPRFSFTSTSFGAVAGAGKLLGLDSVKMTNAFGIVGTSTPVPANIKWQHTTGPVVMLKLGCWTGWIAELATVAAISAAKGFTGDRTILDGEYGFWKIYGSPYFKTEKITEGLGQDWHIEEVWFKPYPSCGLNHAGIDGINKIMTENRINPEDIEDILVTGSSQILAPNRSQTEMVTFEDAQFVVKGVFALVVYHGRRPGPHWQIATTWQDPKIDRLSKKVRVEVHPEAAAALTNAARNGKLLGYFGGTVEITAGGQKYRAEIVNAKGPGKNPLTEEEILAKFRDNAAYSPIRSDRIEKAIETINNLEKVADISELMSLLCIEK